MMTKESVNRGGHTGIGNKSHVDLGGAFELFKAEVKLAGRTNARHRQGAWFDACRINEICERVVGRIAIDDDESRRACEVANWLETGQWMVVRFSELRIDNERNPRDQKGVAIGGGARHRFDSDCLARARAVFDHDRDSLCTPDLFRDL